jgi:hypothetical protein
MSLNISTFKMPNCNLTDFGMNRHSSRLHSVFTSLDFARTNFPQSLAPNIHPGGLSHSNYVSQWQTDPVRPQAPGSLFVTFYNSEGYDGGILTRLHTWSCEEYGPNFKNCKEGWANLWLLDEAQYGPYTAWPAVQQRDSGWRNTLPPATN